MAKQIILITGGARSGKSEYAETRAAQLGHRRVYVATAEAKDEEMTRRIAEHQKRRGKEWTTIEEPLDLTASARCSARPNGVRPGGLLDPLA